MFTEVPPITGPPSVATTAIPVGDSPGFAERWAAWEARGVAHDVAFRRKMAFAAPMLLIAAVVLFALFGR
jgi:hypothetical protein